MNHKKLLQMMGIMLIVLSLGCGLSGTTPALEAPAAADTPESPAATNTSDPPATTNTPEPPTATPTPQPPTATPTPKPTDTPEAILAVAITEDPVDFGKVEKLTSGNVRMWMGFGGTLKNIGNVTLTDLSLCVDLKYKGTTWESDCSDVPDVAVGETQKYGAGFFLEGKGKDLADGLEASSYVITVQSGDKKVSIKKTK